MAVFLGQFLANRDWKSGWEGARGSGGMFPQSGDTNTASLHSHFREEEVGGALNRQAPTTEETMIRKKKATESTEGGETTVCTQTQWWPLRAPSVLILE